MQSLDWVDFQYHAVFFDIWSNYWFSRIFNDVENPEFNTYFKY